MQRTIQSITQISAQTTLGGPRRAHCRTEVLLSPLLSCMAGATPLSALNRSSANVAQFLVTVYQPRKLTWQYTQKRSNREVTAHKMECLLLGPSDSDGTTAYATAIVKGTAEVVEQALAKFTQHSKWMLSKVVFDAVGDTKYISAPLKVRVDLSKSIVREPEPVHAAVQMAMYPVPPRTVAETAGISDNRTTDLLAIVKSQSATRPTKTAAVADVELVDGSTMPDGKLGSITVSVFGEEKLSLLRTTSGPMVFFNLSVKCKGTAREIIHWPDDRVVVAPECQKATDLTTNSERLRCETDTHQITTPWEPSQTTQKRDVSGQQPLSCCAFLDFTAESPTAKMPEIVQVNWAHLEEPQRDQQVTDKKTGSRIWFIADMRDSSGAARVGIPERIALQLASCINKSEFETKHSQAVLHFPLFCNVRLSRRVTLATDAQGEAQQSAGDMTAYVSHIIEDLQPVDWSPASAPNASYASIINILNQCPVHEEGIVFTSLQEAHPSAHYSFEVRFNGLEVAPTRARKIAALVGVKERSQQEPVGTGYKVTTSQVIDLIGDAVHLPGSQVSFTLVGYCQLDEVLDFKLGPARGQTMAYAVVLISEVSEADGVRLMVLDKVEPIDNAHRAVAVESFTRFRRLAMGLRPVETVKRSRSLTHLLGNSPSETKMCRTLGRVPTDADLPDCP